LTFLILTEFVVLISSLSLVSAQTLVPGMHGMSIVSGVKFTWIIVSSDNELSINIRYSGNGTAPPITIVATALTNDGQATIGGSQVLDAGWISPNTMAVRVNGSSSLYDANLITVVASPYDSPSLLTQAPPTSIDSQPQATTSETPYSSPNTQSSQNKNCYPSYIGVCVPPPPALINCSDIPETDFTVKGPDPHDLDRDGNGIGCESSK